MTMNYTHLSDLAKEVQPPDKGILSRTLLLMKSPLPHEA